MEKQSLSTICESVQGLLNKASTIIYWIGKKLQEASAKERWIRQLFETQKEIEHIRSDVVEVEKLQEQADKWTKEREVWAKDKAFLFQKNATSSFLVCDATYCHLCLFIGKSQ